MGKLRSVTGADPECVSQEQRTKGGEEQGNAEQGNAEQRLAERLEEWRHRPDLCLMWVAFCTTSTLTLADGVSLAKTRRSSSEALDLLQGLTDRPTGPSTSQTQETGKTEKNPPEAQETEEKLEFDSDGPNVCRQRLMDTSQVKNEPDCRWRTWPPQHRGQGQGGAGAGAGTFASGGGWLGAEAGAARSALAARPSTPPRRASAAVPQEDFGETPRKSAARAGSREASDTPQKSAMQARPGPPGGQGRSSGSRGGSRPSRGCRAPLSDPRDTNVAYFRHCVEVSFKPWVPGDFATVGNIAKSVHGEVQHLKAKNDFGVVAKVVPTRAVEASRGRERNERRAWFSDTEVPLVEDLWNEIAVLTYLQQSSEQCRYLIRFLGMFRDPTSTYSVTEYCESGELFERVACGEPLAEAEKRRWVWQLLQAARHLHRYNVGHRDISLENVLLRRGDCVLMDFGQAVRLRAVDGTVFRYFVEAGKRMYRSPEMHVPREHPIQVVCPSDGAPGAVAQVSYDGCRCEVVLPPDAVPGKPCAAEPFGYAAAPVDVFACGVCAFVLVVGKPPWTFAQDMDPTFSFIRRHGVPMLLQQWRGGSRRPLSAPPDDETSLLAQMLRVDPRRRPRAGECLRSPWLALLEQGHPRGCAA